jgi:hypothetical protein
MDLEQIIYRAIIATKLSESVRDSDLSQEVVAKRASNLLGGVKFDNSKISRILTGKQDPTLLEAWALCKITKRDLNSLIPDKLSAQWLKDAVTRIQN